MPARLILASCLLGLTFCVSPGLGAARTAPSCAVSAADELANDRLDYDDFDQKGTLPSTWRALDDRGCDAAAIDAMQDYLVNGPAATDRQRDDLMFHLGQSLGMAGRDREAALAVAGARHGGLDADGFDWQTYVVGTWAFFTGDRTRLVAARDALRTEPGRGNALNAGVLNGLVNCFGRPYREAYARACRR